MTMRGRACLELSEYPRSLLQGGSASAPYQSGEV